MTVGLLRTAGYTGRFLLLTLRVPRNRVQSEIDPSHWSLRLRKYPAQFHKAE